MLFRSNERKRPESRDAILLAVAKARAWIDDLLSGRFRSFAEIARSEGKVERHIRLLAPLAFLLPQILTAIANGTLHQDVAVTTLARAVPSLWELPFRQGPPPHHR